MFCLFVTYTRRIVFADVCVCVERGGEYRRPTICTSSFDIFSLFALHLEAC